MKQKIRVKCPCGTINMIPAEEMMFRRDANEVVVCRKCCRKYRWESSVCLGCSDNMFCAKEFKSKTQEFLDDLTGG